MWQNGKLVGVAQILKVAARRGSFLHVRHGPVLAVNKEDFWYAFIAYMKAKTKSERALFFRMNPLIEDSKAQQDQFRRLGFVPAAIHAMDGELCWVLDLHPTEEELLAGMRKTTRYEVRRADKLGITISATKDSADLSHFFALYEETSKRHGFVKHRGIQEEFELFAQKDRAVLYLAHHEGHVIAASIILFIPGQAIYHHSASTDTRLPASYLLQWEAIKEAKKRGIKLYNFWGIADENNEKHPWRGITLFKKGFGGRQIQYIHAIDYPVSSLYRIPRGVETVRRILKGY